MSRTSILPPYLYMLKATECTSELAVMRRQGNCF
jgi:hypothetical protein